MSSAQGCLIQRQKVWEIYGPCASEKLEGEGMDSEDSKAFQQDACSYASVASGIQCVTNAFFVGAQGVA